MGAVSVMLFYYWITIIDVFIFKMCFNVVGQGGAKFLLLNVLLVV